MNRMNHTFLGRENATRHYDIHGIVQHNEVGHSDAVWDVRLNPNVQDVFEQLHGTNDLLVSFDGMCYMHPKRAFRKNSWAHFDQNSRRKGLHCVQGYVNLYDSSDDSSGSLWVVPESHKKFDKFWAAFPDSVRAAGAGDWYKLDSAAENEFFADHCPYPVRVHGPRGSLVLWDSRMLHQNVPAMGAQTERKPRAVVYVCYQPRRLISAGNLEKKQKAFREYRMTTHWPSEVVKLFPVQPRWNRSELAPGRDRVETPRMLQLAGVEPMPAAEVWRAPTVMQWAYEDK